MNIMFSEGTLFRERILTNRTPFHNMKKTFSPLRDVFGLSAAPVSTNSRVWRKGHKNTFKRSGKEQTMKPFFSERAQRFTESVIREMTRVCLKHQGVNLAQGFPDFPAPAEIKNAATRAILGDFNQYAITWGTPVLRQAIAEKFAWYNGITIDPETKIKKYKSTTRCFYMYCDWLHYRRFGCGWSII